MKEKELEIWPTFSEHGGCDTCGMRDGALWIERTDGIGLLAELGRLKLEVERLKSGKFTPEEFQNLCHEDKPVTAEEFAQGCCEYQRKLFGYSEHERIKLELEAEKAKVKKFFSKLSSISLRFDACQGDLDTLLDDEWS